MHLIKFIIPFFAIALLTAGCKKDNDSKATPEECAQGRSVGDGDIIEGQYIIAYDPSVGARGLSAKSLGDL